MQMSIAEYSTNTTSKYVYVDALQSGTTWDSAEEFCNATFGTHLASIHSDDDQDEASTVCATKCWIGLKYIDNTNEWQWSDGTEYEDLG